MRLLHLPHLVLPHRFHRESQATLIVAAVRLADVSARATPHVVHIGVRGPPGLRTTAPNAHVAHPCVWTCQWARQWLSQYLGDAHVRRMEFKDERLYHQAFEAGYLRMIKLPPKVRIFLRGQ